MSKGGFINDQCGTVGCAGTGWGISIIVSPSVYRCAECVQCLNALAPNWVDELTNPDAHAERNRALVAMDADTLREQAAPALALRTAVRRATHALADDVADTTFARQAVIDIVKAADEIIGATVTNWWAAHRRPQHYQNHAPESAPYALNPTWLVKVHGSGIGTVRLAPNGPDERYEASDLCGGPLRPDLLPDDQPHFDSPAEAAAALTERAQEMGWVDSSADAGSDN